MPPDIQILIGTTRQGLQTSLPLLQELAYVNRDEWFSEWMPVAECKEFLANRDEHIAKGTTEWMCVDRLVVVRDMVYHLKEYDIAFRSNPAVHKLFEKHHLISPDTNQLIDVPNYSDLIICVPDAGNEYITRTSQHWQYSSP